MSPFCMPVYIRAGTENNLFVHDLLECGIFDFQTAGFDHIVQGSDTSALQRKRSLVAIWIVAHGQIVTVLIPAGCEKM